MPELIYSNPPVAGEPENINEVISCLEEIRAIVNALDDENFAVGADLQYPKLDLAGQIEFGDLVADLLSSENVELTAGVVRASGNVTLDATDKDITGATLSITPDVASLLLVETVFDITLTGSGVGMTLTASGRLNVDGAVQTAAALLTAHSDGHATTPVSRATVTQKHVIPLTAAAHTVKLQARGVDLSVGSIQVNSSHTSLGYLLVKA